MFPQGLPDEYAFVTTFKFRKTSRREDWYLWQIFDKYGIPQVCHHMNSNNVTFMCLDVGNQNGNWEGWAWASSLCRYFWKFTIINTEIVYLQSGKPDKTRFRLLIKQFKSIIYQKDEKHLTIYGLNCLKLWGFLCLSLQIDFHMFQLLLLTWSFLWPVRYPSAWMVRTRR